MSYDIGPKIGIEGEAEFRNAINGINTNLKTLGTEMLAVTSKFDKNEKSTESLTAKNKVLNKQIDEQKSKLSELEKGLAASAHKYGENDKVTQGWQQAVNKATAELNNMQRELDGNTKALDELGNETNSVKQDLNGLENQASKTNTELSKDDAVKNLKNMATTASLVGAAVGAALIGMANAALSNADELQRQADVTGLSAERLQELTYAGNNLGVELDVITGAQAKLTKSMASATDESKGTGAAFAQLGIDVRDKVTGELRDSKVVMEEAFTALNGVGNETERDALAMQIFGKSAMEMNPLIKAGGDELARLSEEARNNGAVMSDEAVAGLDAFGDTIDNLKTGILSTFGEKFSEVLPKVQEFLNILTELPQWINENSTELTLLGIAIGTITALVITYNIQQALLASGMTAWGVIAAGATTVTTALGAAFAFLTSPIGIAIAAIGAVIAIGVLLYKNWDTVKSKAIELGTFISNTFNGLETAAKEWGNNIVTGLWNGIVGAKDWIVNKVKGFAGSIAGAFTGFFDINSPSGLTELYGKYIDEGLAQGIDRNANLPIGSANSLSNTIGNALQKVNDFVSNTVSIVQKKFKLWQLENDDLKGSSKELEMQLAAQQEQSNLLTEQIKITEKALADIVSKYGEGSTEAQQYKNKLLDLQIAQAGLTGEIKNTTDALNEQLNIQSKRIANFEKLSESERSERQSAYSKKQKDTFSKNESEIKEIARRNNVDLGVAQSMYEKNELDKIIGNVPKYAQGTNFHPGGLAWVGDGGGPELLDLPRGSKVYSNKQSMEMVNASRPINLSLNIGTLIADDYGLKQLERKLRNIRINENFRLGVSG